MSSIKNNFLYSSILTTANYVFPFLTYPYISRILGVDNIGVCNFVDSIINYFILFSMMGIGVIGIREIAKNKYNKEALNCAFKCLFFLNAISTLMALLILIISIIYIPHLFQYKELMFVGVFKLIFNFLLLEWLYKGLEEFKYITLSTLVVKVIYVLAIFVFVRRSDDYPLYYLIATSTIIINAVINCFYARKFIFLSVKKISLRKYIKPFFTLGVYNFLTSMYTSFNVAYLGFLSSDTEVGYYTTATRIFTIILALYTAFTGVLLPRMSLLVSQNKMLEFHSLLDKSVDVLLGFSIPIIVISTIMASDIIYLISGNGYEGAIIPMQLVMPLTLIIGYEQILVIQILMPLKKDRAILINSFIGAFWGVMMNVILVPSLMSIGSSVVWLISELIVLCCAQFFVYKFIKFAFPFRKLVRVLLYHLPLFLIVLLIKQMLQNSFLIIILVCVLTGFYVLLLQSYILKNEIVISLLKRIKFLSLLL